jgi:metal transporter CNNM
MPIGIPRGGYRSRHELELSPRRAQHERREKLEGGLVVEAWIWLGIAVCLSQSAMLSGLNLAVFRLSRLRLEYEAERGNEDARRVLALREDANYTLAAILWGNVAVNVLLTLLAESVIAGIGAFFFSTVVITLLAEILPQAWFSQHALRVAAALSPVLRAYRILLWPVARPVGIALDAMVGREAIPWFKEEELSALIEHHARAATEIGRVEARGAVNFLALDDIAVAGEGEPIAPDSIIVLPFEGDAPVFPAIARRSDDPFLRGIAASGKKWIVLVDAKEQPRLIFSAPAMIAGALFDDAAFDPQAFCHHPLIVHDPSTTLGRQLARLRVDPESPGDDVVDEDVILLWTPEHRRIITGSDILGRLLRRIAKIGPQH